MPARQRTKTDVEFNREKASPSLGPCRASVHAVDCSSGCGSCPMDVVSDGGSEQSSWLVGSAVMVFLLPLAGAGLGAMLNAETAIGQVLSAVAGFSAGVLLSVVASRRITQSPRDKCD